MTPRRAVVDATCAVCQYPVAVDYELNGEHGGPYRWQKWLCPWCESENGLSLSGLILGVSKLQP
jgi:hypothetical protein